MKKIAVLFPGIGYHTDKPLLYYSKKLAKCAGYEIREIEYSPLKSKSSIRGNRRAMEESFYSAYADVKRQLDAAELRDAQVLFISKSIGTIVSCACAKEEGISARQILYTPLEDTFRFLDSHADVIVFHGTADQWVDSPIITSACEKLELPLHIYEGANHSIETGDVDTDLVNLRYIMHYSRLFIG